MNRNSPPAVQPRCLALVLVALVASAWPVHATSALYEGTIDASRYRWLVNESNEYQLVLTGGRELGITDEVNLPAVDLLLLVPADLVVTQVRIEPLAVRREPLPGTLAVAAPLQTSEGEEVAVRHLVREEGVFPATWGGFGGLHTWHGYRLLAVTVHPVRQHAATGEQPAHLEFLERFAVHPVLAADAVLPAPLTRERQVAGEREQLEATLRHLVANPIALASYQRPEGVVLDKSGAPYLPTPNPSLEGSGVRYLIITTAPLAAEFQRLADHRTAQGLPAKVVTREWIAANIRQGIDFQATLRTFLQQAYAKWGVEFVLLGGDTEILPTRFVRSTFYPTGGYTDIPTDVYFACLDGNWNANGNGWLAEPYISVSNPGDAADLAPELAIGRAPVRDIGGASAFIDKVITYDTTQASAQWPNRVLLAAEVLFPASWQPGTPINLDGAQYAHTLITGILEPFTNMTYWRMYETNVLYPSDAVLTRSAFIQAVNTANYGHVNQFGHGHFFNMSLANANFTVADVNLLHNAPNYFLLFALNCASAAFDVSCLLERFVESTLGGAIVSIGAARAAYPSSAFNYQSHFYEKMASEGILRPGLALNSARLRYIGNTDFNLVDRWTQLNLVLLGDPAISIWMGSPRVPQITAPTQLAAGEQTVQITVQAGGAPVSGADVCLVKDGETYAWGITDGSGQASLTIVPQTAGTLTLTVSGANLARTALTIPVVVSPAYVKVDELLVTEGTGNQNGQPEAGEVLQLHLVLQDVGGAGATGLTANLVSDDPNITIMTASISVPDVPPGGTVTTTNSLAFTTPATIRDGTSVRFRIVVASAGGGQWVSPGEIEILAPEAEVVRLVIDDSVYGNGDGIPQSGERLVLHPYVKNYGAGRLDQLIVQLVADAPGVTVHDEWAYFAGIELLAESAATGGALSLTLGDIAMMAPAHLQFVDNFGRGFSQPLEFNPPPAPDEPQADATIASDTIALRWEPVGAGRTLGYHVYRAESAAGPFARANSDLVLGTSYFEDRGLAQLAPYWYKVSAVDTFLIEGPLSPMVYQTTSLAELPNFPLPFATPTSGHAAVGDVTGDGRLEIVLASNEVYVWRDDGTELIDGDNNAQTTGPFTNVNGQFEPAGVALANLINGPGLQIIASERLVSRKIHIYKADGTALPGWPRTMQASYNWATPAVGDVTGDGRKEIVVNDTAGRTFVWRWNGTELRDGDNDPATDGVFVRRTENWGYSSPALYDLDGDGACEIIFGTRYSNGNGLLAYKYDGTPAPGFPIETGTEAIICSPALADLDGDGQKEIIFSTVGNTLHVVRANGDDYPGFPIQFPGPAIFDPGPSPAVGNFDDDPDLEIVWPVNGPSTYMDIFLVDTGLSDDTSGTIMPGWPVRLPANTEGSPVVGDINGDGIADIVQPIGNSNMETPDRVYAFNADGTIINGFPINLNGHCRATPVICDLNGDGRVNIVYGSWDNLLHVWDMPFPYDVHTVTWPTFHGNYQRTGVAQVFSVTAVEDQETEVPAAFTLLPPYPNPFNPVTTLRFFVTPGPDRRLDVAVYDLRGRRVRALHDGLADPGWHELTWDGRDDNGRGQASGVYFVKARQAGQKQTYKLTLVK